MANAREPFKTPIHGEDHQHPFLQQPDIVQPRLLQPFAFFQPQQPQVQPQVRSPLADSGRHQLWPLRNLNQ